MRTRRTLSQAESSTPTQAEKARLRSLADWPDRRALTTTSDLDESLQPAKASPKKPILKPI